MKSGVEVLLILLAVGALFGPVSSQDHTYVNNLSSEFTIIASTVYSFGNSQFTDRSISPGTWQADEYSDFDCQFVGLGLGVEVDLSLDGGVCCCYWSTVVGCDRSVVGVDSVAEPGVGVDIYQSVYGNINEPEGDILFTINKLCA